MGFSQLPLCFRVKFGITECVPACHGVRLGFWHIFRLDVTVLWQEVVCLGQGPGKGADSLVIGGFSLLLPLPNSPFWKEQDYRNTSNPWVFILNDCRGTFSF